MSIIADDAVTLGARFLHSFFKNLVVILSVAAGLAVASGCRPEDSTPPRQAIFVLLDAARPDRFSCYGYERATTPEMDRLASEGMLFRHHFAQGTSTRPSMTSLLSSRYFCIPLFPHNPRVPYSNPAALFRCPDQAQISFVKALEADGFKTAAISAHMWTGENTAFAAEFSEMHDLATRLGTRQRPKPSAEVVMDYAIKWIKENKDRDYFLYVHLMDTHVPHYFEADAQHFFGSESYDASNFDLWTARRIPESALTKTDRRYADALYDGSLRYTDRHVGRLAEFLRQENLLDSTILAITSDHGEHLFDMPGEKSRGGSSLLTHGGKWFDAVAKVPLIIHGPRLLQAVDFAHFSEGVDLGPTLLALLHVPMPKEKEFDGIDLVSVSEGRVPPKEHVLKPQSIRTAKYKCIFDTPDEVLLSESTPSPQALSGQLYDLVADPHEINNIFQSNPQTVRDMLARYRTSLKARFQRYQAARCSEQPRSAFAIAAKFVKTDIVLPEVTGDQPWEGWARLKGGGRHFLVAVNSNEPLSVQFPMPNGIYTLSLDLSGKALIKVGTQARELSAVGVVEFGDIEVTDEVFKATIQPRKGGQLGVKHFGFVPSILGIQNRDKSEEQLERLRALGYVE